MTTITHTRNEDIKNLTPTITVVARPPLTLPPQLPPRGFTAVLRITRAETQTDTSQAPSSPVTDWSTAVRLLLPVRKTLISLDARVPGLLSAQRRPAPLTPRALLRTSGRRSDYRGNPGRRPRRRELAPQTSLQLNLGTRAGAIKAALPNHAPRSTTSVAPSRHLLQRGSPPPGHAVTVGLR